MSAPKPTSVVFITNTGLRVPVDLRYAGSLEEIHMWAPVIDDQLATIMTSVVAIDADSWPAGTGLHVPAGPGYDDVEWALRIQANSPILQGYLPG
jgi:hypothetical protein